ncbi:Gamma-tubulin complex component 6 [Bulinus truncatus]|nr:Gamma-tubulin complex component 6 [Bulinus truncatus]
MPATVLNDDAAVIHKAGSSSQFRQLQLYRQEMQHFVKMMQGYITSQVIHVSWQEFQADLSQPINGLDQLCALHKRYVNRALFRCLLDAKAVRVLNIIQDIFCLILKFRSQLVSAQWQHGPGQEEVTHGNFPGLVTTYQSFQVYSFFLFKVVSRLSEKGYQPHLQELLLQLNFNGYYTQERD